MSQTMAAELAGLGKSTLCMIELSGKMPRARSIPRLAAALGCSIGELFEGVR